VALTPRLQLLKSETAYIDCLAFFEVGYSGSFGWQYGPGVMLGRRWRFIEPYFSYRFRHYEKGIDTLFENYFESSSFYRDLHAFKIGTRVYFPCWWCGEIQNPSNWFLGVEGGPTVVSGIARWEWGVGVGFDY